MSIVLDAGDAGDPDVSVSTTLEVDLADPRWQQWLVDAVAAHATEGARRLRDELLAQDPGPARHGFVPLAALVPSARD